MQSYILLALPLSLALFAFSLSRPWTLRQFLASREPSVEFQKLNSTPFECLDRESKDTREDGIGFIPEYAGWNFEPTASKISVATTTSADLNVLLPWIFYHRLLGVEIFYIFVEGELQLPENHFILKSIPGVKVNSPTNKLREKQIKSVVWKGDWLSNYQYKPCNHQLYIRQTFNLEAATSVAKRAGMKWILHLSVDELIVPGGVIRNSLASALHSYNEAVDLVVFPIYESVLENDKVREPFTETGNFYSISWRTTAPRYFLGEADGCIAARLQTGLHPSGPQRWSSTHKALKNTAADEAVVLHYTYTRFADLLSMRFLCPDCQPEPKLARRCFFNEFDSMAFTAAKTLANKELMKWYRDHLVWGNKTLVTELVQRSILVRNHIPQIVIQGLREVGFFQETTETGKQAFEDSLTTERLQMKEMVRRGQKAGKLKFEMASLNFSKGSRMEKTESSRPRQTKLLPKDHVEIKHEKWFSINQQ
ncbi:hypothetical protein R1sor_009626 [Riccia sorocarpa]|uniref:Glycosyltransferase family 92 protein n=1 Tax=Riccia sorocarpa TaxID=122646 RepID=A0ABD3HVL8_9MARC